MPVVRRIAQALAVLALGLLCIRLGFWQWHRMEEKQAANAAVAHHLATAPIPVAAVREEWTRVRATGTFLPSRELTVKFMVRDGAPGVDVMTPLMLPNGQALLIDRGWMPSDNDNARPSDIPPPPRGTVTIVGWWRPDSRAEPQAVEVSDGQVRAISSRALESHVGRPLLKGYVNLQRPVSDGLSPEPHPHFSSALNFFYALQWWFFSGLILIGTPWLARRSSSASR